MYTHSETSLHTLWKRGRHPTLGELMDAPHTPLDFSLMERVWVGGRDIEAFIVELREKDICVTEDAERLMRTPSFMLLASPCTISLAQMIQSGETIPFDALLAVARILREYGSMREVIRLKTPPLIDRFGIARTFLITGEGPTIRLEPACGH